MLIARILQLNLSFVLKTQTEIEGFAYPVWLKANQKCRLPFSCTASAFLTGFLEFSLQKAEFIFHIGSNISLIPAATIEKEFYPQLQTHGVQRLVKSFLAPP